MGEDGRFSCCAIDGARDVHSLKMGVIDIMNVQVTMITRINKMLVPSTFFRWRYCILVVSLLFQMYVGPFLCGHSLPFTAKNKTGLN